MAEPKTADELHKLHLGNLMVQVINLQAALEAAAAEVDMLRSHLMRPDGGCTIHSFDCALATKPKG